MRLEGNGTIKGPMENELGYTSPSPLGASSIITSSFQLTIWLGELRIHQSKRSRSIH